MSRSHEVDQSGHRFPGVDRVEKDSLSTGEQINRFGAAVGQHAVARSKVVVMVDEVGVFDTFWHSQQYSAFVGDRKCFLALPVVAAADRDTDWSILGLGDFGAEHQSSLSTAGTVRIVEA